MNISRLPWKNLLYTFLKWNFNRKVCLLVKMNFNTNHLMAVFQKSTELLETTFGRFSVSVSKLLTLRSVRYELIKKYIKKLWSSYSILFPITTQKMKFSTEDFFCKCDQIRNFLWPNPQVISRSVTFCETAGFSL